jgi:hypothetical protein
VCEIWFLTLREDHRLRVFENRALRRIFGPKRGEVTRGWRKLRNEELHELYSKYNYNDQVTMAELGGACSTNGGEEEYWWERQKEIEHWEDYDLGGLTL